MIQKNPSKKLFSHILRKLGYIANGTRPDMSFDFSSLSRLKTKDLSSTHIRDLNQDVRELQKTELGIVFPKLDIESVCIRGYSDAGFANTDDLKSQLSIMIFLIDKHCNASLIHYASWKSRRIVRSVLAAELFAFVSCNDFCQILAHDMHLITGKRFPVHLITDSKSIFDTITKLSSVSEKRLMIDISALRQSYSSGEISNIGHVSSKHNLADSLTKRSISVQLKEVLKTGKILHPINNWIIHDEEKWPQTFATDLKMKKEKASVAK